LEDAHIPAEVSHFPMHVEPATFLPDFSLFSRDKQIIRPEIFMGEQNQF